MKGKDLKEFLACNGISISHLAKLLSYSDQRLHSALKSDDIKSGLLEEIARVTNRNVCDFYVQPKDVITAQDPTVLRLVDKIAEQAKEIGRLEQELEDAKRKKGSSAYDAHTEAIADAG